MRGTIGRCFVAGGRTFLQRLFVSVLVVQIGGMRMRVLSGSVVVGVTVLALDADLVAMIVMPVIVAVGVFVLDRLVAVPMTVTFGQVQEDSEREESSGDPRTSR